MRKAIITTILLGLYGCKGVPNSIENSKEKESVSVSLIAPSSSTIVLTDIQSGEKKEFSFENNQDIEFSIEKDKLPDNNVYQLLFIIGSVFLGFLVFLTALEFLKRRST